MRLSRFFDSVITRLLLLALVIVILGTLARYFVLTQFLREDMRATVESQQMALAQYVAHEIDYKIVQRQAFLERLAATLPVELLTHPEQLRAWLKERHEYQPLFSSGLFVVNPRGTAIVDYPVVPGRTGTDYSDRDYFQAGLAGHPRVGRAVMGRALKLPVLPMATPIRNANHDVVAVLVGITALGTPGFLDALLQSRIGNTTGGFLLVSPRDKLFVASSQPEMVLTPTPAPGINPLHDRAMGGFRGTGVTVNAQGIEEVSAIASVPSTDWFVVARLPGTEAFSTVQRLKRFMLKNALLVIAVFMALSWLGLSLIFRPLFRAAEHADRMTRGEAPLEPLPITRNDEIGHLIAAFNRLLVSLNDNRAELARIAHHDLLTGLPNRALLADRVGQMLAQAQRKQAQVCLLFLDLDGFKFINDSLGHEAGDEALRQVAERLVKIVRQADTLARIGGDEFVLLLSDLGTQPEEAASTVATKCIDALKKPVSIAGIECNVGVSIGIALGGPDSSFDALLLAADRAMYQAKDAGRGRYVICSLPPPQAASAAGS